MPRYQDVLLYLYQSGEIGPHEVRFGKQFRDKMERLAGSQVKTTQFGRGCGIGHDGHNRHARVGERQLRRLSELADTRLPRGERDLLEAVLTRGESFRTCDRRRRSRTGASKQQFVRILKRYGGNTGQVPS